MAVTIRMGFTAPSTLQERCAIAPVDLVRDEPGYDAQALLPASAWEPVTPEQIKELISGSYPVDGALVEIVRPRVAAPRHDAPDDDISGFDPFQGHWSSWFVGFVDNPAGQATTTVDTNSWAGRAASTSPGAGFIREHVHPFDLATRGDSEARGGYRPGGSEVRQ